MSIRDLAGWIRCWSASKSWPPSGSSITISPSTTYRPGGKDSSGKYRPSGLPLRDWIMVGSTVDEHDRPEAVVLGLVGPLLADGKAAAGARQLRLDRRVEGQIRHCRDAMRWGRVRRGSRADARGRYDGNMAAARATVAEEEYVEMLFWLFEAGLPMTGANLARAMQLSAPTVHEMLGRLERDGYIARNAERMIEFTPVGARARRAARQPPPDDRAVLDRHRRACRGTTSTRRPRSSSTR